MPLPQDSALQPERFTPGRLGFFRSAPEVQACREISQSIGMLAALGSTVLTQDSECPAVERLGLFVPPVSVENRGEGREVAPHGGVTGPERALPDGQAVSGQRFRFGETPPRVFQAGEVVVMRREEGVVLGKEATCDLERAAVGARAQRETTLVLVDHPEAIQEPRANGLVETSWSPAERQRLLRSKQGLVVSPRVALAVTAC